VVNLFVSKKKHKKHPEEASQAKKEDTPKDDNLLHNIRAATLHALSNGWVQNSGVAFLLAVIALIIAMETRSQIKSAAIGFAAIGSIALWIFALVVIRYAAAKDIVVTTKFLALNTTEQAKHPGPFWIKYKSPLGDTVSPLPVLMYIVIHNSQATPEKIATLRVSMQAKGDEWLQLMHVDAHEGQIFWIYDDFKKARQLEDPTTMLDFILGSSIPANSSVEGWLYFTTSQEYPCSPGTWMRFKFFLKDTSGKTMECPTEFNVIKKDMSSNRSEGYGENIAIKVIGPPVDLSHCAFKFWTGGVIGVPDK
jgi:hypothetical protein